MRNLLIKEMMLSASALSYLFVVFGLMFFLPGYPILCGAFFTCLGIFQSFQTAREANDLVFSALLPVAKRDVARAKVLFACFIELCAFALMALSALVRMTALADAPAYRANALMCANPFALGMALLLFGLFNLVFVAGFFTTSYQLAKPLAAYAVIAFVLIVVAETLHHIPGLEILNAFGFDCLTLQLGLLATGIVCYIAITARALKRSAESFERIDL